MKILLSGAQGQIGSELKEQGGDLIHACSRAELDICDLRQVEQVVAAVQPSLIINTAAYTAVDQAESEPDKVFATNRDGVRNLAIVAKKYDLPLLHLSTDYVFDGSKPGAYLETDPITPLNIYGASKAAGEAVLQAEWEKHLIIRVSWVFGLQGKNFVKTIFNLAAQKPELKIVADQKGCPTAAEDVARLLLHLAERVQQGQGPWGIFHYCGDKAVTWFEFAMLIVDLSKDYRQAQPLLKPVSTTEYPTPAQRPKNSVLNTQKIAQAYGIKAPSWQKALPRVLKHLAGQS